MCRSRDKRERSFLPVVFLGDLYHGNFQPSVKSRGFSQVHARSKGETTPAVIIAVRAGVSDVTLTSELTQYAPEE